VLRGPESQPVANDDEPLSCGRTLAQVVALVVQAVAKRHFRAKMSLRRRPLSSVAEPTLMDKVTRLFSTPAPPKMVERKVQSPGDKLFRAMRDYLLFEWQLRLIPHYVGLTVPLVETLGARLLEFTEIEDIQWMARTGQPLPASTGRQTEAFPLQAIKPDLGPEPTDLETEAAAEAQEQPEPEAEAKPEIELAPQTLPEGISAQRFVAAVLGRVNAPLAHWLAQELNLTPRQIALVMIRAYEALPAGEFQRFGASAPASDEAVRFLTAARAARFGADTSPEKTTEFARLYVARIRSLL